MSPISRPRQRGVIAVLCCAMALGMLAMFGLALDLAMLYNRKAELQALANATALAAARELNGTSAGIANATAAATTAALGFRYQYNRQAVAWSGDALRFAAAAGTADDGWTDAAGAQAAPLGMMYAKVDTRALQGNAGVVATMFMLLTPDGPFSVSTTARAVAGRVSTLVTPLAICAQSPAAAAARANVAGNGSYDELVEFGFRRGVAYDLMNLNPDGATPENFLIDPLAPPGVAGTAAHFASDVVGPFICAGQLPMPTVMGGRLTLRRGFPLDTFAAHLNSRFDDYTEHACTAEGAPPDSNIMPFDKATITWMTPAPSTQSADSWQSGGKLWTRADPLPGDASNSASLYGALWAFARAVPYSAYAAQPVEPASGYNGFAVSAWSKLYAPGPPSAVGYPTSLTVAPYVLTGSSTFRAPTTPEHQPGVARRRVLNVALLDCPVAAGAITSASVRGVGRFFMTVPATASRLSAEFGGAVPASALSGAVELQR
ncbi:pilus assembly protein TadE [Pseudoduganella sp. FT25W]|uniref:Pilus assembly protein TadE n=1 Tax=Duganella alba TaxID=2666081 RepID=A0A6L5QCV4_9BURK|nr:pilus assembly protein TadG-related protein [Duganella alba]MRX07440.1 pilus assembly protein TadE [Duganella alba]MRX15825.1 pilus assembly protein TadE [Duganella alba]